MSDDNAKAGHWEKGARFSIWLFNFIYLRFAYLEGGSNSFLFIAGHTQESGYPESPLARADKRSWLVAPMWWLWWNYWVEWQGKGMGVTPPPKWKRLVAENLKRKEPIDSHQLYIQNRADPNPYGENNG